MKKIKLTRGKYALVDDEDFEKLNQHKWFFDGRYAARDIGGRKNKKRILMHRLINNTNGNLDTDHINQNKLDNRRHNLRDATRSQNNVNSKLRKDNMSGFKGVVYDKTCKKWRAYIGIDGKQLSLGYYKYFGAALLARKLGERIYFNQL